MRLKTPLKFIKTKLLFSAFILNSSCALIFNTRYDTIYVESDTRNAEILVDGNNIGKTNEYIRVPRAHLDNYFTVEKEGCESQELNMPLKTAWGFWLNTPLALTIIGAAPMALDLVYDAHQDVKEKHTVHLECDKKE